MPLRMIDWKCPRCGYLWEELTETTSQGMAVKPRCNRGCMAFADRQFAAPSIRTNDNMPRELRTVNTAGHPVQGTNIKKGEIVSSQLGRNFESRADHDRFVRESGLEIVTPGEYSNRYLSHEPPPPRLEDDPALLRETQEEAADTYDQAVAGKLPPLERPMLEQDAEGRDAAAEIAADATPIALDSAAAVEGA